MTLWVCGWAAWFTAGLIAQQPPSQEAQELVQRLAALPGVSPEAFKQSSELRRLIVLDLEAVPALESALRSEAPRVRAAAIVALREIGRLNAVRQLRGKDPDPAVRLLVEYVHVETGLVEAPDPRVLRGHQESARGAGLDSESIESLRNVRIKLSEEERRERCTRLIQALYAASEQPSVSGRRPGAREAGRLGTVGVIGVPILMDELRGKLALTSKQESVVAWLAFALSSNLGSASGYFENVGDDAPLLSIDHKGLLDLALQLADSSAELVRTQGAALLARIAGLEHGALASYAQLAEKRLAELADDKSERVREEATAGLRRLADSRTLAARTKENLRVEAEKQARIPRDKPADARKEPKELSTPSSTEARDLRKEPEASTGRAWWALTLVALGVVFLAATWRLVASRRANLE